MIALFALIGNKAFLAAEMREASGETFEHTMAFLSKPSLKLKKSISVVLFAG